MSYTYLIECPDGRRYYGVRYSSSSDPAELWQTYFTSSKEIHELLELHGKESFRATLRKIFSSSNAAIEWESKVLRRLKVRSNPAWVNKSDNTGIPPMYGDDNPSKRYQSRQKISAAKIGKPRPDQRARLLANHHMKTEESRNKVSSTRKQMFADGKLTSPTKGKKRPEISGAKHHRYGKKFEKLSIMNSIEYTCPHCQKIGKGPGMKRYHFDNCKSLLK